MPSGRASPRASLCGCWPAAARAPPAAPRITPDSRAYRPHVTMAYLRRPDPADVAAWIQANSLLKSPPFAVDRFGLYSTHQTSEGSRYLLEREYRL